MTVLAIVQSWYVLGTTKCVFDGYVVIFIVTRKNRRTVNDPSWVSGIYFVYIFAFLFTLRSHAAQRNFENLFVVLWP